MKVLIGKYPKIKRKRTVRIQIDHWDLWNADYTMALIIRRLLKRFRERDACHPGDLLNEEWLAILDKIIWSMDHIAANDSRMAETPEDLKRVQEGCELLGKWFQHFWI